jgi:hypothetical protein
MNKQLICYQWVNKYYQKSIIKKILLTNKTTKYNQTNNPVINGSRSIINKVLSINHHQQINKRFSINQ